MYGCRFIAVGDTCVDAERVRRSGGYNLGALRQCSASGIRSIARLVRRQCDRGAKATHGGIGVRDEHYCRGCNVDVDVGLCGRKMARAGTCTPS